MATTIYDRSLFKQYFPADDAAAAAWAANVLAKLVAPGQVAKYVKRAQDGKDTDFERLFQGLLPLLSYLVRLGRQFGEFKDDDFLSDAYLNAQGQYTAGAESLAQLQALVRDLLRVPAARGTTRMITPSADPDVPSGEVLRLLGWTTDTFFKLGLCRPQYVGWCLDHSGPAYRGLTGRYDLNVGYESTEDVETLVPYPLINSSYVSLGTYLSRAAMRILAVPPATQAGIGSAVDDKGIVVDPQLGMEVTFYVAQATLSSTLTFGVRAFDAAGAEVSLVSAVDGTPQTFCFQHKALNQAGRYYFVRGIVYAKDASDLSPSQGRLNVGFGNSLRFVDGVVRIVPQVLVDNNTGGSVGAYLWNVKVTPVGLPYERCWLGNSRFIDVLAVNRNPKYSLDRLYQILREQFINYNTPFWLTWIQLLVAPAEETNFLLLESGDRLLLESADRILLEV